MNQNIHPPIAQKIDKTLEKHGDVRLDPYYWMNDRENPKTIDYLNAENAYTKAQLADTEDFQKALFDEIKARIKEDDQSVPYFYNDYWYITRYEIGQEYPIHERKKGSMEAATELLFNVNQMAKSHEYYDLKGINISEDNQIAAFGEDTVSRRIYTIRFKNLKTGEFLPDVIENTTGGSTWANDNQTVFYTRKDETLRPYQIYRHVLGTNPKDDVLVYEEKDNTFNCFVYKTKSRKYLVIGSGSTTSDEYQILEANNPTGTFKLFQPRTKDLEYSIAHYGDHFYIRTNKDGATNFKLMQTAINQTSAQYWTDLIPHQTDVLLEDFEIFKDYLVLESRNQGLLKVQIRPWNAPEKAYELPFTEPTYTASIGNNPDFNSQILRYGYSSLTTPSSVIDFNMTNQTSEIKKEQAVLGTFNKNDYQSERLWITARDGVKVPVSLVYNKNLVKPHQAAPLLLYGYGSYGITVDATFSSSRLSLLDRGFVFAIAHIRGGEYLGRPWYENGKLLHKKNTFNDFVDVAKGLISENRTTPDHLFAMGGSAGGLLMGAVINQAPELFKGIIAAVPFVDVVTTMLDETIPLTTGEYDEWGNPNDKVYYDYMKSYSPYDNIEAKAYPNMLVTTGLHDSQVQYWEPAKWVAKLRELKTDHHLLLLHTNMDTGHGGASGRFEALKEIAMEWAFLLKLEDIKK